MKNNNPIIILLEHREDYQAIYGMNLTLYLGAEVHVANTIKAALDLIDEHEAVLLFVNNDAYSTDIGSEVWKIFDDKRIDLPLFVLGNAKVPLDEVTVFDSNIQLRDVLRTIAAKLKVTASMMAEKEFPDMFPLPSKFIIPGWQSLVGIYILKDDEFQIQFQPNEIILNEDLDKLKNEENFQLYVIKEERLKFVNSLTGQISAKLNDSNLTAEERIDLSTTGYQMVMEQGRKIGIGESTMELANSCISSMTKIAEDVPKLEDLLSILLSDQSSLRYKHSLLINYIGAHIIKKTKWGNQEQQDKFAFISFFQNITLTKDEYVLFNSDKQLENSNLSDSEKTLVKNHALSAARLVAGIDNVPFGAATVIKQHHGSNKGKGLSQIYLSISPLAIVFLFAQEWANLVFKFENEPERPSKSEIIKILHKKYNKPGFNKILPVLHSLEF
jgi:hypothetical protein